MRTEVYSWRLPADLKMRLEREARRRNTSLSKILDLAARERQKSGAAENEGEEEQLRLQRAASKYFGAFAGGDARRSESARH